MPVCKNPASVRRAHWARGEGACTREGCFRRLRFYPEGSARLTLLRLEASWSSRVQAAQPCVDARARTHTTHTHTHTDIHTQGPARTVVAAGSPGSPPLGTSAAPGAWPPPRIPTAGRAAQGPRVRPASRASRCRWRSSAGRPAGHAGCRAGPAPRSLFPRAPAPRARRLLLKAETPPHPLLRLFNFSFQAAAEKC